MIPNQFHLIWNSNTPPVRPFILANYLSIKSIVDVNKPDIINFYTDSEPSGEWWDKAKSYVKLIHTEIPSKIFGISINHPANRIDVLRLQILIEHGGIYTDLDVFCIKPLTDLLKYECVMGAVNRGLCNGIILAEPKARFLVRYLSHYDTFDNSWDGHATILPGKLAQEHPEEIHIEPQKAFHWPQWNQMHDFFERDDDYSDARCMHFWTSHSWPYVKNMTIEDIQSGKGYFHRIARGII